MSTRIERQFQALKDEGRAGLVTFLTAGDPDAEVSLEILKGLPEAGADLIEIGVPFSDPMADGPAIQASSLRAIKAGMTLAKVLDGVRSFRENDNVTPIVLMGYYNPIYIYGVDKFLIDAKQAGVDGFIVVDGIWPEDSIRRAMAALHVPSVAPAELEGHAAAAALGMYSLIHGRLGGVTWLSLDGTAVSRQAKARLKAELGEHTTLS